MKRININLVRKKRGVKKPSLYLAAVLASAAIGFTGVNIYEYFANSTVITTYENRLAQVRQNMARRKKEARQNRPATEEEQKQLQQERDILRKLVQKNLFPVLDVLTRIEHQKPEKLDIDGLKFSGNLHVITITAESSEMEAVAAFIENMKKSDRFSVTLARQEIRKNHLIGFELVARWVDGQKS